MENIYMIIMHRDIIMGEFVPCQKYYRSGANGTVATFDNLSAAKGIATRIKIFKPEIVRIVAVESVEINP